VTFTVLEDIAELAVCPLAGGQADVGLVPDAALAWADGRVAWAGPARELPTRFRNAARLSAQGRAVVPGLIDAHTHLAFGGDRAGEFTERLGGTPYLEIARRGGGIAATVRATRAAAEDDLYRRARATLAFMQRRGVTTVEAKSGYGLDVDAELRTLRLYRRLNDEGPQRIVPTYLGAHVVPPEHRSDRTAYLRLIADTMMPRGPRRA
jgi:imidazolonepropionase